MPWGNGVANWARDSDASAYFRCKVDFNGVSDAVMMLAGMRGVTVALYPTGTARVEYTVSPCSDVMTGNAKWIAWPLGDLTSNNADELMSSVTAIRGVGVGSMEIRGS